jgi:formylglycine-generating enzyme required for sulfatase activity
MNPGRRRLLRLLAGTGFVRVRLDGTSTPMGRTQADAILRPGAEAVFAGIRMCWCPPGRFLMGSPQTEPGHRADEAQVEVKLTRGFWMGKFEVSQGQWSRLVGAFPGRSPSEEYGLGDDLPVYWVSYDDATRFCELATTAGRTDGSLPIGWRFTLPTEAQWEYACRAGTTTATAFGDLPGRDQANFAGDAVDGDTGPAHGKSVPVGSYRPNAWGLSDMHGNVFEWCRDWYHARLRGGVDPDLSSVQGAPNPDGTYSRVRRGGAWNDPAEFCRSAFRLRYEPHRSSDHIGFRVAAVSD